MVARSAAGGRFIPVFAVAILGGIAAALPVAAGEATFVRDSTPCKVSVDALSDRALRRALPGTPDNVTFAGAAQVFDSLGYFAPVRDTVADTVVLTGGERARIDTFLIKGDSADAVELPEPPPTPRPYDAGEVVRFGARVLHAFAAAGYPFASLDLALMPAGSDFLSGAGAGKGPLRIVMTVRSDRRYAFGRTVFLGLERTKAGQLLKDVRFGEGERFDSRLVDETVRRLAAREYIDSVRALPPRVELAGDSAAAVEELPRVMVPLEVHERAGLGLDGAVGLEVGDGDGSRLAGTLDFTLLNTFGVGERASLRYRGERGLQRLAVDLSKAYVGEVPVFVSGAFSLELVEDEYGHLAGDMKAAYELSSLWRVGAGISAQENTVSGSDSMSGTWHVYGVDFFFDRPGTVWRRRHLAHSLHVGAAVAVADRGERDHTRWTAEFAADIHVPLGRIQALAGRIVSRNLFTEERMLTPAEVFRVGGHGSIRGYAEEQCAFRNVAYAQFEYLLYFGRAASAFIFIDGGVGFRDGFERSSDYTTLLGYGLGVRMPVRIGSATIQWGRSIDDNQGLGRIHVRITNRLAREF